MGKVQSNDHIILLTDYFNVKLTPFYVKPNLVHVVNDLIIKRKLLSLAESDES